ncbi:MAG TPA: metalloregulator ArsR/SmtB family transcription factor, partial [Methanotrichaceae archaeon]|nr:metalloregulator ArsR/SmtB family transcription factor [Methanotrichaceae archaeon]
RWRIILQQSDKACECQDACCEAEKSLMRLIGDRERAKERCIQICSLMDRIDDEKLNQEVKVFKAIADPTRLKILKLLMGGELCVCEIMIALKKPQSSISHNLSILEDAGLVKERKDGKWCHYRLSDVAIIDMINLVKRIKG